MLRKRLKNDEDGAGELEEGESSKKKSSKTDKSLVCNYFDGFLVSFYHSLFVSCTYITNSLGTLKFH